MAAAKRRKHNMVSIQRYEDNYLQLYITRVTYARVHTLIIYTPDYVLNCINITRMQYNIYLVLYLLLASACATCVASAAIFVHWQYIAHVMLLL